MSRKLAIALAAACLFGVLGFAAPATAAPVDWSGWTPALFAKAKAEKRFVILDLQAVWCHWCHVMEQTTYADPKVQALLEKKYLPVRVDQDGNPDLSSRYGDWGWPATIILAADGTEIAKLRGYIPPDRMAILLQAVIDDPSPGPSVGTNDAVTPAASPFLSPAQRAALGKDVDESWDADNAGWGSGPLRYIDADSLDLAMAHAEDGDAQAADRARKTLAAARALIDPVWGGVYQYSDKTDWSSPHFEKIMSFQAQYLREYSQAYSRWHDPAYLAAAKAIEGYLVTWLRGPDGAFYTSQDADLDEKTTGHVYYKLDDAARRKLGIPRIDTHQYARENGWAISALAAYYDATGDAAVLKDAVTAARWVEANRALPNGGFRHGADDRGGPFLGDTLAMGRAFLDLYAATGDRHWLDTAQSAADFTIARFEDKAGGFTPSATSEASIGVFQKTDKSLDDEIGVARFMNMTARYTGKAAYRDAAAYAMKYAVGMADGLERPLPGLLLADRELSRGPTHVTVVGHKDDPLAQRLDAAARALPSTYLQLDWWDKREGDLVNPEITYPELDTAAAFACGDRSCSLPVTNEAGLTQAVATMAGRKSPTMKN